jgi:hypothetical protein
MATGTPVVASNVSALPEVLGDAALLVNPENVFEIARAIQDALLDEDLRAELIAKGKAQAARYSWERTAREVLESTATSISQDRTLAPAAFNQDVTAPTVNPAMRYPTGMWPRWLLPPSRVPCVSIAIPTVVSVNPHIARSGRHPPRFDYSRGRRDANHNFGHRGAEGQPACKNRHF